MLASDIEGQTVGLCPADGAAHFPIMTPLYFEKPADAAGFMDFNVLRSSFYRTLTTCLPHALGTNFRSSDGPLTPYLVTVNSAAPKLPLVTRHMDDECTIAAMRQSGFMPHVQPKAILCETAKVARNPLGGDPLVTLDIVYMSDGVGVLLVISHAIVDMGAYCRFIIEWGLVAKAVACGDSGLPRELDTDRGEFWSLVSDCAESVPATEFERHLAELDAAGAEVPPAHLQQATIIRLGADPAAVAKLSLTRDRLCPGISVPNFISALLWRITGRASQSEHAYFSASLTIRGDPRFSKYWGNTSTSNFIHVPRERLLGDSLVDVARRVQDSVREFSVANFARLIELFTAKDSWYNRSLCKYVGAAGVARFSVVNISRSVPFYDIDFGWGRPVKVMYQAVKIPGLCFFMPWSQDGGIEAIVCLSEPAINALFKDELILNHFDVVRVPSD
ncbi:hypothetical protein IW152_002968 [Coemansia sp. BCRC 34962]|nr:hypothetical protein IW152_002968 [Coemansia sp. BCRC 34962]